MTIRLKPELERLVNEKVASGEFHNADDFVAYAVREALGVDGGSEEQPENKQGERPIWEAIEEIWRDVPAEELAKLPRDGASQHDHYIYGLPKKDS